MRVQDTVEQVVLLALFIELREKEKQSCSAIGENADEKLT
jgi:hypothetical protein